MLIQTYIQGVPINMETNSGIACPIFNGTLYITYRVSLTITIEIKGTIKGVVLNEPLFVERRV